MTKDVQREVEGIILRQWDIEGYVGFDKRLNLAAKALTTYIKERERLARQSELRGLFVEKFKKGSWLFKVIEDRIAQLKGQPEEG